MPSPMAVIYLLDFLCSPQILKFKLQQTQKMAREGMRTSLHTSRGGNTVEALSRNLSAWKIYVKIPSQIAK